MPERAGEPSVFKHVIYIIKENRTYDQVLGDVTAGNGDAELCSFGERVTPNQHKLVREFVLLDNTYCSGILSADGHNWADSGIATDYLERSFAGWPRSYPAGGFGEDGADALAYSPAGFIWDNALAHGKTVHDFGEFTTVSQALEKSRRSKDKIGFRRRLAGFHQRRERDRIHLRAGHRGAAAVHGNGLVELGSGRAGRVCARRKFIKRLKEFRAGGQSAGPHDSLAAQRPHQRHQGRLAHARARRWRTTTSRSARSSRP